MLIAIFGESCVGKSTFADRLVQRTGAALYTGKDYKRLAKNEDEAKRAFSALLQSAVGGGDVVWVLSETEDLPLIPNGAVRVLMTAELPVILGRFQERMHGHLPQQVAAMLERKHGCFDGERHDYHVTTDNADAVLESILTGR